MPTMSRTRSWRPYHRGRNEIPMQIVKASVDAFVDLRSAQRPANVAHSAPPAPTSPNSPIARSP